MNQQSSFAGGQSAEPAALRMQRALADMRAGRPVIVCDDFDRENEADLIVAAETMTVETMARFIRDCSGIVCLCLTDAQADRLDLPPMVAANQSAWGTAFTVSIEAASGVSTGVSAADRITTIRAAIADGASAASLHRPGHVFPLRARPGGVLERRGHTESAVDLARLAGLKPAGVLCELMNDDGTMTRGAQLDAYARRHGLTMISVAEIVAWRLAQEAGGRAAA